MSNNENNVGIIQQLILYIKNVFSKTKGLSGQDLDKVLIAAARNEEEAEVIEEMCDNVELYYKKRAELRQSELKGRPGRWLEKEIENTVKEVCPEADSEDIDEVKSAVSKALENEIEVITNLVEEEITPVAESIESLKN